MSEQATIANPENNRPLGEAWDASDSQPQAGSLIDTTNRLLDNIDQLIGTALPEGRKLNEVSHWEADKPNMSVKLGEINQARAKLVNEKNKARKAAAEELQKELWKGVYGDTDVEGKSDSQLRRMQSGVRKADQSWNEYQQKRDALYSNPDEQAAARVAYYESSMPPAADKNASEMNRQELAITYAKAYNNSDRTTYQPVLDEIQKRAVSEHPDSLEDQKQFLMDYDQYLVATRDRLNKATIEPSATSPKSEVKTQPEAKPEAKADSVAEQEPAATTTDPERSTPVESTETTPSAVEPEATNKDSIQKDASAEAPIEEPVESTHSTATHEQGQTQDQPSVEDDDVIEGEVVEEETSSNSADQDETQDGEVVADDSKQEAVRAILEGRDSEADKPGYVNVMNIMKQTDLSREDVMRILGDLKSENDVAEKLLSHKESASGHGQHGVLRSEISGMQRPMQEEEAVDNEPETAEVEEDTPSRRQKLSKFASRLTDKYLKKNSSDTTSETSTSQETDNAPKRERVAKKVTELFKNARAHIPSMSEEERNKRKADKK